MRALILSLSFLIFSSGTGYGQQVDSSGKKLARRQYAAFNINVSYVALFAGLEAGIAVAPVDRIHVHLSYKLYGMIITDREGNEMFADVRYCFSDRVSFEGFYFGLYYGYGNHTYMWAEKYHNYTYYDKYHASRHLLGGIVGYTFAQGANGNLLIDLYVGAGRAITYDVWRDPSVFQFSRDQTFRVKMIAKDSIRTGLCFVFAFDGHRLRH